MWLNLQFPADLVTFTEEIHNGKLHFLCSVSLEVNWNFCRVGIRSWNSSSVKASDCVYCGDETKIDLDKNTVYMCSQLNSRKAHFRWLFLWNIFIWNICFYQLVVIFNHPIYGFTILVPFCKLHGFY